MFTTPREKKSFHRDNGVTINDVVRGKGMLPSRPYIGKQPFFET